MTGGTKSMVFISFDRCDGLVRNSFLGHLSASLRRKGMLVFMDCNKSSKKSTIDYTKIEAFVVVISKNYLLSTECLNELAEIVDWQQNNKTVVIVPVFHGISQLEVVLRSDILKLREGLYSADQISRWTSALKKLTDSCKPSDHGGATAIHGIVEYIPTEGTENPRDKDTEISTCKFGANQESSSSDAINDDFLDRTFTNSRMDGKVKPPEIQVFINFRGDQLRNNFVGYLVHELRRSEINVYIDNEEERGEDLNTLFKRIEDSGIAIVVFSSRYTESKWCLEELVKIKERVHQGLLKVLPIFYKVTPTNVKRLKGEFGDHFRDKEYIYESNEPMTIKRWKEAIVFVSHKFALTFDEKSVLEIDFVDSIVREVLKMLPAISKVESGQSSR